MTHTVLTFGASNSKHSINKKFASYAAHQLQNVQVNLIDLNDFEMPIYSIDREKESGIPQLAHQFKKLIREADAIVISFAEHNSAYTTAFKNIFDWISRIEKDVWLGRPLFLISTAPGGGGGRHVLQLAMQRFSRAYEQPIPNFSLPQFATNFDNEKGIVDDELKAKFQEHLQLFQATLNSLG
jgi:NAD(P)H-dependent FMN reductase